MWLVSEKNQHVKAGSDPTFTQRFFFSQAITSPRLVIRFVSSKQIRLAKTQKPDLHRRHGSLHSPRTWTASFRTKYLWRVVKMETRSLAWPHFHRKRHETRSSKIKHPYVYRQCISRSIVSVDGRCAPPVRTPPPQINITLIGNAKPVEHSPWTATRVQASLTQVQTQTRAPENDRCGCHWTSIWLYQKTNV